MKILLIIENLDYGGIQTQALNLGIYLKNKGFEVHFLGYNRINDSFFKNLTINNIKVHYWPYLAKTRKNKLLSFLSILKTILKLRYHHFDIFIPYHSDPFFSAISRFTKTKLSFIHMRRSRNVDNHIQTKYERLASKNKIILVSNSEHGRSTLSKIYDVPIEKIKKINNGVNIRKIENINWKNHFNTENYSFVAVSVANFYPEKDYETIFNGWEFFIKDYKGKPLLLIAGLDPKQEKTTTQRYKNIIKEKKLEDSIRFLGSIKENFELMSIADVGILSSLSEGFPNIVLEFVAMGVPFIGTNIPGIKEIVGDDYPIPLFNCGDYKQLSVLLQKIAIKNAPWQEQLKDYQHKILENFSVEKMGEAYYNLILENI